MQTDNKVILSGNVNKTYKVSVVLTTLITNINDTFDDVAGNSGLGGWGIPYGGTIVTVSGANKALKLVNSGSNVFDNSRGLSAPIAARVN